MTAPSISFDPNAIRPMWTHLTLEEVRVLICGDVAELNRLFVLRAGDEAEASAVGRQPDYRLRTLIKAWEDIQDVHWAWHKEIQDAGTAAAHGPSSLGIEPVGQGN
jgi:hypothetical protein